MGIQMLRCAACVAGEHPQYTGMLKQVRHLFPYPASPSPLKVDTELAHSLYGQHEPCLACRGRSGNAQSALRR